MLYMNPGNVNLHRDLVPPQAHFHNWYIVMLSCLENPFIPVSCVTGHAVKLQMEYFLQKWALQVKKLCIRGVWRMEAPKWEGLIRNVWIYWLSSNVDTWQAKVINISEWGNTMNTSIFSWILLCHHLQLQNKRGHFWLQPTLRRSWEGTAEKIQHGRHV